MRLTVLKPSCKVPSTSQARSYVISIAKAEENVTPDRQDKNTFSAVLVLK